MTKKTEIKCLKDGVQIYDGKSEKFVRTNQTNLENATNWSGTKSEIVERLRTFEKKENDNDE